MTASHKNASFDLLERLSRASAGLGGEIMGLDDSVAGAVVFATCNRFEAYLDLDPGAERAAASMVSTTSAVSRATEAARHAVSAASGVPAELLERTWTLHTGEDAARHLFAVSAGLESVVVGEGEISGQVRRALEAARESETTTPSLERLFQRAAQTSRGVKSRTPLGRAGRSIVRLGLELAEARVSRWSEARVLLVGTGAYAGASLAALRDRGVTDVAVYSPSGRAEGFARSHDIRAIPESDFAAETAVASIIITCTTAEGFVVDAELLDAGQHALRIGPPAFTRDATPGCPVNHRAGQLVIDLGLPRNVNPDVAGRPGVDLLDLETIKIHAPLEELHATDRARQIVNRAARKYASVTEELALDPAVVALRARADQILAEEIARVSGRDADGVAAEALRHMMGRLLHRPSVRARELARAGEHSRYVDALEALLGLEVPAPAWRALPPAVAGEREGLDVSDASDAPRTATSAGSGGAIRLGS